MVEVESARACRIICTLGPASASEEVVERLVLGGMDVARLNFSHGTHEGHRRSVETIRAVSARLGRQVAILQDLQGHKVRTGVVEGGLLPLRRGQRILLGEGGAVEASRIGIDYRGLAQHVRPGHAIYLDDGIIELVVRGSSGQDFECEVLVEGDLRSRKGVTFPDSQLAFPLLNGRDIVDARFGFDLGVDMVAMSFVRAAAEVQEMRRRMAEWGSSDPYIVAKIEERQGIENLEGILGEVDAVLIARGDLGVTLPREEVPGVQRRILESANAHGVPVITATQMLESMTVNHRPTRAEVSDVYHAVTAGSDAVMLSGETASGKNPVLAVEEMQRICCAAERDTVVVAAPNAIISPSRLHARMAEATAQLARSLQARCVLSFSISGTMLRALSAARCPVPVYGVVAEDRILRRLLLHRGLSLRTMPQRSSLDDLVPPLLDALAVERRVVPGDSVVVVVGRTEPGGERSHLLKVCTVA